MLLDERALGNAGAEFIRVDRGGDITFHGPGQLVGYPVLDLAVWRFGAVDYVRALEQSLISLLDLYHIEAERVPGRVGVWTSGAKVAAIGVRISRGITYHGFALNVATDLRYFDNIIPCGIADAPVTSMEQVLGREIPLGQVEDRFVGAFAETFQVRLTEGTREELPLPAA
jgi:lipoyl(octanoyl) transferase